MPAQQVCSYPQSPYLQRLTARYGSRDYSKVQTNRKIYYSYVAYPAAGSNSIQFFGTSVGASNRQLTNIQQAGKLDYPFLVKAIRLHWFIADPKLEMWQGGNSADGRDANTLYSDIVNGFFQCGVLQVTVGTRIRLQLPNPFLYAPPGYSTPQLQTAGIDVASGLVTSFPFAALNNGKHNAYLVKPAFEIEPTQSWKISLDYPAGLVPIIAANVVSGNTLYVGVHLDGVEIRPTT